MPAKAYYFPLKPRNIGVLSIQQPTEPYAKWALPSFRSFIEERFYRRISEKARLEHLIYDETFLNDPQNHIGLYSDHGYTHVRDVAARILLVLQKANGVLFPKRKDQEWEFMQALGVHLAYVHDIGMVHFSDFGRFMHPEFATHYVFDKAFQNIFNTLWSENSGGTRTFLENYGENLPWQGLEKRVLREMLSMAVAHSKSKVPINYFHSLGDLRNLMLHLPQSSLNILYHQQKIKKLEKNLTKTSPKIAWQNYRKWQEDCENISMGGRKSNLPLSAYYKDFNKEGFQWLTTATESQHRLSLLVLDTLRCLRAADALRQRGTTLRTSAGYEMLINQKNANVVYALRSLSQDKLYLLESEKALNAGEANIAGSELDERGNLIIDLIHGDFPEEARFRAVKNAALAIYDIQSDVVQSFKANPELYRDLFGKNWQQWPEVKTKIGGVNLEFLQKVQEQIGLHDKNCAGKMELKHSKNGRQANSIKKPELLYSPVQGHLTKVQQKAVIDQIAEAGLQLKKSVDVLMEKVQLSDVKPHQLLVAAHAPSQYVLVALEAPLFIKPLGGYEEKTVPPAVPVGTTGVIRQSERNAHIYNGAKRQWVMVIPAGVFLQLWFDPWQASDFYKMWIDKAREGQQKQS